MPQEGRDRRVNGQREISLPSRRAQLGCVVLAHPEPARQVELERVETGLEDELHGVRGAVAIGHARQAYSSTRHVDTLLRPGSALPSAP